MMPARPVLPPASSHLSAAHAPTASGGRLVDTSGRALPRLGARLLADACGGVARVVLAQRFRNPHTAPLVAKYTFPLPAGAAVSGFVFTIAGRRLVGRIDRRAAARAEFERALVEGRGAAILDQERTSLFTQEIGNVPPGAEVVVELVLDQPLSWLDEGAWEWRFPMAAAPRYLGGPGRVQDAQNVTLGVASGPMDAAFELELRVRDRFATGRRPESTSHAIDVRHDLAGQIVWLRDTKGAPLDRDVVVRWAVAREKAGLTLDVTRPPSSARSGGAAYGLLTITPPDAAIPRDPLPRDVVLLLDTSGSMSGEPLRQAQRVASAIVSSLGPRDTLEMIEFSTEPRRFQQSAVPVGDAERKSALAWIASLRATGGTEMREGILEALARPSEARAARDSGRGPAPGANDAQRQVVLVTDGLIGFEDQIVAAVLARLPRGSRVHTVGVGSAVNRSLTAPVARAGRGVEVILGLGEDPERAAKRIVARTDAPLVVDLEVSGSAILETAPVHAPDLFARAPALLSLKLRPEGGEVILRGRLDHGTYEERIAVPPIAEAIGSPGIAALFAREVVEDLETTLAAGGDRIAIEAGIEEVGLAFQISTRLTSWIATSAEVLVDPRAPKTHEEIPQALPYGVSVEGLGLRTAVMDAHDMDLGDEEEVRSLARAVSTRFGTARPMSVSRPMAARAPAPASPARPTSPPPAPPAAAPPPPLAAGRVAPPPRQMGPSMATSLSLTIDHVERLAEILGASGLRTLLQEIERIAVALAPGLVSAPTREPNALRIFAAGIDRARAEHLAEEIRRAVAAATFVIEANTVRVTVTVRVAEGGG